MPEDSAHALVEATDLFGVHPALLDAALHALALAGLDGAGPVSLPFSWRGVSLFASGATTLRVRFAPREEEGSVSLALADGVGEPVATIEALLTRPASAEQLRQALARRPEGLYRIDWSPLTDVPDSPRAKRWAVRAADWLSVRLRTSVA